MIPGKIYVVASDMHIRVQHYMNGLISKDQKVLCVRKHDFSSNIFGFQVLDAIKNTPIPNITGMYGCIWLNSNEASKYFKEVDKARINEVFRIARCQL